MNRRRQGVRFVHMSGSVQTATRRTSGSTWNLVASGPWPKAHASTLKRQTRSSWCAWEMLPTSAAGLEFDKMVGGARRRGLSLLQGRCGQGSEAPTAGFASFEQFTDKGKLFSSMLQAEGTVTKSGTRTSNGTEGHRPATSRAAAICTSQRRASPIRSRSCRPATSRARSLSPGGTSPSTSALLPTRSTSREL